MYSSVATGKHEKDIVCDSDKRQGPYVPPPPLHTLVAQTKFSANDLRHLYKAFKNVCHSGVATKETFCAALSYVFHEAVSQSYAILTFNAFDKCSRGHITFSDFVQTLSRLLHGTREEILNWVFDLYDFDKDGYISRQELTALIRAVHNLLGAPHGSRGSVEDIDEKVNWMFNKFDVDRDGKIGRREFITICLQDQIILESLKAFGNSL
ncbi:Kv channel-interacting protein 4 [Echinococcus granulosus]|uniref:Kv channel interacting protein 4 n=1 Tax=Echinococcus granulosus TaxID=6210 RepID=A0A068WIB6_ECHGR|nr:Kv channel-interacting protein 4 [Echinococcus granulosus]CDS17346.1 Kv channel interacting protein 4 [Echinococcus granulosus]